MGKLEDIILCCNTDCKNHAACWRWIGNNPLLETVETVWMTCPEDDDITRLLNSLN